MEISNLSDAELKTLVIRMLKEISEDLSSIKKTKSEMRVTLIEMRDIKSSKGKVVSYQMVSRWEGGGGE